MSAEILVLVEQNAADGSVKKVSFELLTLAARLGTPSAVVIGSGGSAAAERPTTVPPEDPPPTTIQQRSEPHPPTTASAAPDLSRVRLLHQMRRTLPLPEDLRAGLQALGHLERGLRRL